MIRAFNDDLPYDQFLIQQIAADRLDLKDVYLRMCKERGVRVVISTDSHSTGNLQYIKYGVLTARRGWLTKADVLNTLPPQEFLAALRPKPGVAKAKQAGRSK